MQPKKLMISSKTLIMTFYSLLVGVSWPNSIFTRTTVAAKPHDQLRPLTFIEEAAFVFVGASFVCVGRGAWLGVGAAIKWT
jgi:hypothetical protein